MPGSSKRSILDLIQPCRTANQPHPANLIIGMQPHWRKQCLLDLKKRIFQSESLISPVSFYYVSCSTLEIELANVRSTRITTSFKTRQKIPPCSLSSPSLVRETTTNRKLAHAGT